MSQTDKTFPSGVDWWLGAILVLLLLYGLGSLGFGIYALGTGTGAEALAFVAAGAFVVALLYAVVWPVRYVFTAAELHVHFGRFRFRYPYAALKGARPTHNPLSAPALSLKRIVVSYEGRFGELLISPADRDGFLRELARRCQHLEYRDGEVHPRDDRPPDQSGVLQVED